MDLQKYRTHGVARQPTRLLWGEKGVRMMPRHLLLQLWIAGILLGAVITLILWDLRETGWSRLRGNIVLPLLVVVSLVLAFNAVYWAPRPGDQPHDEKGDDDSLNFR
jgi:hypothetical protein